MLKKQGVKKREDGNSLTHIETLSGTPAEIYAHWVSEAERANIPVEYLLFTNLKHRALPLLGLLAPDLQKILWEYEKSHLHLSRTIAIGKIHDISEEETRADWEKVRQNDN